MSEEEALIEQAVERLRRAGARFAYLFGSRADGSARQGSDVDIAAFFGRPGVDPHALGLPEHIDVLVLDQAPLELAGRVATQGRLLFDDDAPKRVEWEATTRKIFFDERPRIEQARQDFIEGAKARGRR